ncbi:ADP-glyceromanno-heptose 6-epimerase [Phytohabitans sp. ZYX-F-186]|uniref:ADP-L-glycero-D-manno-heptose-6-epimerase n=1 Tax=Phytohabitans maris TaxID=3071409 RepID=A0ABU0ZW92_9ACTN|nr:ADP-glyceromanno-heptose 6-epimerase [Phytohabitans sp. ZYX-F-186]MDQ7911200.1 ADP-glyceromanno-heptose 6-epimerase [Phytohabitans sp. ZYX-F-186]
MIVVTGAAGFIGRNVAAALNARGRTDLILADRLGTDQKWRNLRGLEFEDLLTPEELPNRLESTPDGSVEAVLHLGACSATTETDADFLLANNYRYTRRLAEWAVARSARFVYASSAATYGDGALGYLDHDAVTPTLRPLNMYGYSKHMFDLWALRTGLLGKIVGLKYFNVYGPHEDHKGDMRSVVNKAYGQILDVGHLSLFRSHRSDFADGEQRRDFIHVDDAVAVTLHFLDHRDVSGLFNCGTGTARTWLDLGRAVFAAMGREPDIRFVDMPDALRANYQYLTQADPAKLRAAGYKADFLTLEEGVDRYVRGHLRTLYAEAS